MACNELNINLAHLLRLQQSYSVIRLDHLNGMVGLIPAAQLLHRDSPFPSATDIMKHWHLGMSYILCPTLQQVSDQMYTERKKEESMESVPYIKENQMIK